MKKRMTIGLAFPSLGCRVTAEEEKLNRDPAFAPPYKGIVKIGKCDKTWRGQGEEQQGQKNY